MRLLFDVETDGLLENVSKVHCIVAADLDTNQEYVYGPGEVAQGIELLQSASLLAGHNIASYDFPALAKLRLMQRPKFLGFIDTIAWSRASHPTLKDEDFVRCSRDPRFPKQMIGRHSIEAWAWRLGEERKVQHEDWTQFSNEMLERCRSDVRLNVRLFRHLEKLGALSLEVAAWESEFAWVIARQERHGVRFDEAAAIDLYTTLRRERDKLSEALKRQFGWWWAPNGVTVPKRDNKKRGIAAGAPYTKLKKVEFNPGSRDHIARVLMKMGWRPRKFTTGGKPQVDEAALAEIAIPEAKQLIDFLLLEKRIGQIATGDKAWLKLAKNGRIHGRVETTGARTSRCAHYNPNVAQTPRVGSEYGYECRSCFIADDGHDLVGADASGLELRMLAHFMQRYDGGEFGRQVHEGDPHTYLLEVSGAHCDEHRDAQTRDRLACNLGPKGKNLCRARQKITTYAFLYGAGNSKLGSIMGRPPSYGERIRRGMKRRVGSRELDRQLEKAYARGYVRLLDGRHAPTLSRHDTLNTLLQGCGAVLMKYALVIADQELQRRGYRPIEEGGLDYEWVLNVHDEAQATSRPEIAREVGEVFVWAIQEAGRKLGVRVPLAGEWKVGKTWANTH